MSIKDFIKAEFSGWSRFEQFMIPMVLIAVFSLSLYAHDRRLATIHSLFGITATIISGKGKISCYFFGIAGVLLYSCLAWQNALYGSLLLNLGYYFPMEFVGIYEWKKHLKEKTKEIYKIALSVKSRFIIGSLAVVSSIILGFILQYFQDKFPFIDAFVTVFSVVALYLTVKRCIEQWICWTIVNLLSFLMWIFICKAGGNNLATVLTWFIYLCLGIYFLICWKKEINSEKQNA